MPYQSQMPFLLSLQSLLPYFRRKLEGLVKSKPCQTHAGCYLSVHYRFRAYRLHVYASISPGTEVTPTDLDFAAPSPRSLEVPPPQDHHSQVAGSAQVSHHGPAFGNELSAVTLFFVQYYQVTWELQMYLIIGTGETIATKPETMTFPWGVISQTGGGGGGGNGTRELIYDHSLKLHETDCL